jgi:hypothetical protein
MAKYSYTPGMEGRGLNWIFIRINAEISPKTGVLSNTMKAIQGALSAYYASIPPSNNAALQIIILENLLIPNGAGAFWNAVYFYDPNDPRRLPGDNIRFHDGAQDLPVKPLL